MGRNLVLCFDGTWNQPKDQQNPESTENTNVFRFYELIAAVRDDGRPQIGFYNKGVGTEWWNRIGGGAFGLLLDEHILEGYRWLIANFKLGDDVYVVGFSRGAYTARSLVGLIRKAGLLNQDDPAIVDQAYTLYRTKTQAADDEAAREFRSRYSQEIGIHFVGVWDTVGALGIPLNSFGDFNQAFYAFHDTKLSGIVRNAFQAVAIDEHRGPYAPTLWGPKDPADSNQVLEQAWFAGAHADVGGGYKDQPLSDLTLSWMLARASKCGLGMKKFPLANDKSYLSVVTDSFKAFLDGAYALFHARYYRPMGQAPDGPQAVDDSVRKRVAEAPAPGYRPRNPGFSSLLGTH